MLISPIDRNGVSPTESMPMVIDTGRNTLELVGRRDILKDIRSRFTRNTR